MLGCTRSRPHPSSRLGTWASMVTPSPSIPVRPIPFQLVLLATDFSAGAGPGPRPRRLLLRAAGRLVIVDVLAGAGSAARAQRVRVMIDAARHRAASALARLGRDDVTVEGTLCRGKCTRRSSDRPASLEPTSSSSEGTVRTPSRTSCWARRRNARSTSGPRPLRIGELRRERRGRVGRRLSALRLVARKLGVKWRASLVDGDARAASLAETARRRADLVVVGDA